MDVRKISIEEVDGGQIASVSVFFPRTEKLDGSELAALMAIAREASRDTNTPMAVSHKLPAEAAPEAKSDPTSGRRRGSQVEKKSAEPTSQTTEAASPSTGEDTVEQPQLRRRRVAEAAPEAPVNPPPASSAEETSPRRRSGASTAAAKSPSEELPPLTVADLRKAASSAARDHGTPAVQTILAVFKKADGEKCKSVQDIQEGHREMFVKTLKELGA